MHFFDLFFYPLSGFNFSIPFCSLTSKVSIELFLMIRLMFFLIFTIRDYSKMQFDDRVSRFKEVRFLQLALHMFLSMIFEGTI
jgi:hypothetical protein